MLYPLNIALDFLVSYIKIPQIFPDIYLDILGQHVGFSHHVITCIYIYWLVVWNIFFMTFHILGMSSSSSSHLTKSYVSEG